MPRPLRTERLALIAILVVACGILVTSFREWSRDRDPETGTGPWSLRDGQLVAHPGDDSVLLGGEDGARLEAGGVSLIFSAHARARFHPTRVDVLPEVLEGEVRVLTPSNFRFGNSRLEVLEPAELRLSVGELRLVSGVLARGDLVLRPGATLDLGLLPPPPRWPPERPRGRSPEEVSTTPPTPDGERRSGRLLDARDGQPIARAHILATWTHSSESHPPLDDELTRAELTSDAAGHFTIPRRFVEDPRARLHLQIEAPGFQPRIIELDPRRNLDGDWPFQTIEMRRGVTATLTFVDRQTGESPGERLPITLEPRVEDSFLGEDLWQFGNSTRPGRPRLAYTTIDGRLTVPVETVLVRCHHPDYFLRDPLLPELVASIEISASTMVSRHPSMRDRTRIELVRGHPIRLEIQDASGEPLPDLPLVVTQRDRLERVLRLRTDGAGFLHLSRPSAHRGASGSSPGEASRFELELTSESPLLWKVRDVFTIDPSRRTTLRLPGHRGGEVHLRLLELPAGSQDEPRPLEEPPASLHLDDALTPVHRDRQGRFVFQGVLPRRGSRRTLHVPGYLPYELQIPLELPDREGALELPPVVLDPGETLLVEARGDPVDLARARLTLSPLDRRETDQETDFQSSSTRRIRGLRRGEKFHHAIQGPRLIPVEGELHLGPDLLESGLVIEVFPTLHREVLLEGEVVGIPEDERALYRVIERYHFPDGSEPLTFSSYPLDAAGRFGSRRWLEGADLAEVFIVGEGKSGLALSVNAHPRTGDFLAGKKVIGELPLAFLHFTVEGLGATFAPLDFRLEADRDRDHELARIRHLGTSELLVQNLRPGRYTFLWNDIPPRAGEPEYRHSAHFEITDEIENHFTLSRPPDRVESVPIRLTDEAGEPLRARDVKVQILGERHSEDGGDSSLSGSLRQFENRPGPDGDDTIIVPVVVGELNLLSLESPDLPPVRLELPPGSIVPRVLTLPRLARVEGTVLDVHGARFSGELRVRWERLLPVDPADGRNRNEETVSPPRPPRLSGAPIVLSVVDGKLQAERFAAGTSRFEFRDVHSTGSREMPLTLLPGRKNTLPPIELVEKRVIRGRVTDLEGMPVPGARVSVVRPEHAHRYPLRSRSDLDVEHAVLADGAGKFEIDRLPLEGEGELYLVADAPGYLYGLEGPLDLGALPPDDDLGATVILGEPTELVIQAGFPRSDSASPDHEFRLEYREFSGRAPRLDLGSVAPLPPGQEIRFEGVRPGHYTLSWRLREPLPGLPDRESEVRLTEGSIAELHLRPRAKLIRGKALHDDENLESGWVLVTPDPADPTATMAGRVKNGSFWLPAPERSRTVYLALVRGGAGARAPRQELGEALFRPHPDWRRALASGFVRVERSGVHLEIAISGAGAPGGLAVEIPHYSWSRTGKYQVRPERFALETSELVLRDLEPGPYTIRVITGSGSSRLHRLQLTEDLRLDL